tara:strand:+ start:210 stop:959 length:750 start_codon:yes stop_codon:yes gene_type:complete
MKQHLKRYSKNKFQRGGGKDFQYIEDNVKFDNTSSSASGSGCWIMTASDGEKNWKFQLFPQQPGAFFYVEYSKRDVKRDGDKHAINIRHVEKPQMLERSYDYEKKITIIFDGDRARVDQEILYGKLLGLASYRNITMDTAHKFLNEARAFRWRAVKWALWVTPRLVNVQPKDHEGNPRWSALHQAVHQGNIGLKGGEMAATHEAAAAEAVKMLLDKRADPNLKDKDGVTPQSLAQNTRIRAELAKGKAE